MNPATETSTFFSSEDFLNQYLGHRRLTRRAIEAFPEKEFFNYSIGGMRPFAEMIMELLAIAGPGLKEIISGESTSYNHHFDHGNSKAKVLELWDAATEEVKNFWPQIQAEHWQESIKLFGQWEFPIYQQVFYYLENEIHHRGQGYVYLRSLGIEPPAFYER